MTTINLFGQEIPFGNALLHLAKCLSRRDFQVVDYGSQYLTITAEQSTARYSSNYRSDMLRLLQIVQAVQGHGMDNVPTPGIFLYEEGFARWDRLQNFHGEYKVKMSLAYLGGMELFFQDDRLLVTEANLEKVCEAYTLHEEDRRTPMKAWLEEFTRKVPA